MSMHQHPFSSDFKTMFSDRHYGIFGVGEAVLLSVKGNAVHFAIRMAALKSMRVVGCGVRGRNG